ncbi:MAG: tripartite tricarboxylate transporter TctB family protein [Tissierellia bacterium]|nr:tripartite tricarboxylate transporter TctB family protein [Tissierellia bacterium]
MRKTNLILSVILIAVCGLFYLMISQLPSEASLYPLFVTTLFLILSLILLFKTYFNKEDGEETTFKGIELKQLLFVIVTCGLYVILINITGYVLATILYVLITLIGLRVDKRNSIFISIGFCLFVYVVFKVLLNVPLPKGIII